MFDEYLIMGVLIVTFFINKYFYKKVKNVDIIEFIPNLNHLSIHSTLLIFFFFEIIDFYYEDGFIDIISLWFRYWLFAVEIYLVTHIINNYKNCKYYQILSN